MKNENELSEQIETFKAIKEHNKLEKDENVKRAERELETLCRSHKVEMTKIASYQFRLSQDGNRIDIFPQTQKYFIINTRKHGRYDNLTRFFNLFFK
jgi:acetyl-CoA carboxylase alpha subunit